MFKEAARVSSEAVYISVPNFASLPARLQVLRGRVPENNTRRKGHVVWFTKAVLEELVREVGLGIDKAVYHTFWEHIPFLGVIMKRLAYLWPSLFSLSFIVRVVKHHAN